MAITKIYVIAPANVYTGGPTALHLLCYSLNKTFHDTECLMAYSGITRGTDPVHPEYKKYRTRWIPISKVEDSSKNLLILLETQTHLLYRFKYSRKAIYWLSVDNFFLPKYYKSNKLLKSLQLLLYTMEYTLRYNSIPFSIYYGFSFGDVLNYAALRTVSNMPNKNSGCILKLLSDADLHVAQSEYAKKFLACIGVDKRSVPILREPIEEDFYNINPSIENKNDIISFNSRKTFCIVHRIIHKIERYNKNTRIVPLGNVGKKKKIKILSKSKVFVDIGYHPGRDRPAREAAALGSIVIVNRSGGYYYFEDLPISDDYVVYSRDMACRDINEDDLIELITDAVENYEQHVKNFSRFREYVTREEPRLYLEDLKRLRVLIERL